jgi:hypothetical protein
MRTLHLALALVFVLSACGHSEPSGRAGAEDIQTGPVTFTPEHVRAARLTKSLTVSDTSGSYRPGPASAAFTLNDEIFFFVVLEWGAIDRAAEFVPNWKWYADGTLFDVHVGRTMEAESPYNVWGAYTAFSLNPGNHRVELWIGDALLASAKFTVVDETQ